MNDRKEELRKKLEQNRRRNGRKKLISEYAEKFGIVLEEDYFVDIDSFDWLQRNVYQKAAKMPNEVYETKCEVVKRMSCLKESIKNSCREFILFLSNDDCTDAIKLQLDKIWEINIKVNSDLKNDILLISSDLEIGICVEIEEYNFLISTWGIDGIK